MDLGGINGSKATFILNPATGKASDLHLILTTSTSAGSRRNLSKTTEKCLWNDQIVAKLLDDLGPFYLPKGPVKIGDSWGHTYSEIMKTFGTVTTQVHCTLRSVRPVEGRDVATIEITGDIKLIPESKPVPAASSAPAANKPKDFRIEHAACNGSVEFDLTRGELVQLTLRRDLAFVADVSAPNSGPMQLKTGTEHILRVKTSQTAPPKPIIVGGPKPPVVPPDEMEKPGRQRSRPPPARPVATTGPVLPRLAPTTRPVSHQFGQTSVRPATSRPARTFVNPRPPTTAPAWRPKPATTQPAENAK
jgi:hypothetical protein